VSKKWPAAIVGVGKIGSLFDSEPGRKSVWSHAGAYLARPDRFELAAVCETNAATAAAFAKRCPDVPIYADMDRMLAERNPAVVSVCTPASAHADAVMRLAEAPSVRVVWCEKPLAADAAEAKAMVAACRASGKTLVVSYVRRWQPIWAAARKLVADGGVGRLVSVRIAMPNRLLSIGSHAVDLVSYLGGPIGEVVPFVLPEYFEEGEPAVCAFMRLADGAYATYQVTGRKHDYLVEGEIIGQEGRLVVREDAGTLVSERYLKSPRYDGYREPADQTTRRVAAAVDFSPFVAIADEIDEILDGRRARPTCDGAAALDVQRVLETMSAAAANLATQRT
jgi:predicted dehydrogenase